MTAPDPANAPDPTRMFPLSHSGSEIQGGRLQVHGRKDRKRRGYSGFKHRVMLAMCRELNLPRKAFVGDHYLSRRVEFVADWKWK